MAVRQSAGTLSEEEAFFEAFFDKLGDREIGEFIPDVPPTAKKGLLKVRLSYTCARLVYSRGEALYTDTGASSKEGPRIDPVTFGWSNVTSAKPTDTGASSKEGNTRSRMTNLRSTARSTPPH
jgi:hypothetical protein